MNALVAIWEWIKGWTGRLLMSAGAFVASIDGLDVTAIKVPMEKVIGEKHTALVTIGLFLLGFWRINHVASKYKALKQAHADLLAAHEDLQAKVGQ